MAVHEATVKPRLRGWIHLWAAGISVITGIALVAAATGTRAVVGTAIYALTIVALFTVSATYHRITWRSPLTRLRMKRADHSMIFVFIAGTYTPFCLIAMPPSTGRVVLIIVWAGAAAGVLLKLAAPGAPRWVGVPLYLLLGWIVVFVGPSLYDRAGLPALILLAIGGVLYSAGAVLYATKWPNPWPGVFGHHEFFHAATVLAALTHYAAVWLVVTR